MLCFVRSYALNEYGKIHDAQDLLCLNLHHCVSIWVP